MQSLEQVGGRLYGVNRASVSGYLQTVCTVMCMISVCLLCVGPVIAVSGPKAQGDRLVQGMRV